VPGLFDPLTLRGITLRNRIGVSPMVQTSSTDGYATDWHLVHLGARATGGAGLVMLEATAIAPQGRITERDLGIWHDDHIPGLSRIADFISKSGAVPGIQLGHAGRKGSYSPSFGPTGMQAVEPVAAEDGGWPVIGPSPLPFEAGGAVPQPMDQNDIEEVIELFAAAAARADACGFQVIEVHAAHGYLLHSFCSPLSNQRSDDFGGTFDNRVRLACHVARSIRSRWPDHKPLIFRLSHTDWIANGWSTEDSIKLSKRLKSEGVDLIDVSSGGTSSTTVALMAHLTKKNLELPTAEERAVPVAQIPIHPGYQVPGAVAIGMGAGICTAAVGLITEAHQANLIIKQGKADMVMLGRALLRDPNWPIRAAIELGVPESVEVPAQYYLAWKDQGNLTYRSW